MTNILLILIIVLLILQIRWLSAIGKGMKNNFTMLFRILDEIHKNKKK